MVPARRRVVEAVAVAPRLATDADRAAFARYGLGPVVDVPRAERRVLLMENRLPLRLCLTLAVVEWERL